MDDPHYAHAYAGGQLADDFATYALPESPSSLHSSFSHDSTVFMPAPLPPKPSPRHRNLSFGKPGFPAAPQKQWPPQGFKAPTLQTADPMDELSDSMSPETDWLSPASRSSNMDEYTNVPTGRWGGRSATEGGMRQWQGSPRTSPRGEKMSPRTYKLQMQAAETFEDEARGNPLARVNEGYVLGSDQEVQAKWQRYQQEEQRKRSQAAEAGRIRGQEEGADGQVPRAEFRRYARPAERTWYSQAMETEEQRQAEEVRQERWQQLKEHEANRQRQLAAQRAAVTSPAPDVRPATRMVKQECWARTDGDMLVRKQCWVEEAAPAVCIQVPEHQNMHPQNPPTPPPPQWQPPVQPRADSWHEDDHNPPGTSGSAQQYGSESYTRSRVSRQDWVEGWGHREQRFERRAERRRGPDRPYESDRPHSSSSAQHENPERGHYSASEASSVATFPRSERERAEWEARGRGERIARQSAQRSGEFQRGAQPGGQETRVGEWAQAAAFSDTKAPLSLEEGMQGGGSVQEGGMTVAARWSEQTSRELQFGERPESRGQDTSRGDTPRAVTSIEERVSEVGLVDGGEKIWVEERTVTHKETVADVTAEASGEGADVTSPTLVAEAVSRLALTSVGWDEAMHNFHDLRGVRAVVKKPEELLSPAVVSGAVTLSGLARKRAISLPATEGGASRVLGTSGLGVSHHSRGHSADEGSRGGASFVSEMGAEKANRTDLDAAKGSQTDPDTWEVLRVESSGEERPALRQNDETAIAICARPTSAQARDRLDAPAAGADVSNDGDARRADDDARRADDVGRNGRDDEGWARCFPHPPEARHVSPAVAAIISPPGIPRGGSPVPLARSDSYPPSERPPGRASPVWSTTITSVPILSAPPMAQATGAGYRPGLTLPPRFPPVPLLTETGPPTPAMVPHPPSNPSPRPHLRRASRAGAFSVEERRPPVSPESAFPQYDSEPVPKQSWRGAEHPETLSDRKGDRSENEESWGAPRNGNLTPGREDGNPGQLSRFAPPFRGGPPAHPAPPGRVEGAARGEGSSQIVVEVDCPICSEPLQVGRAMFAPECGHFVHFDCCRSNLLKGSLDCPRCHQRMQQKPYLKTPYGRPDPDRRRVTVT